MKDFENLTNAEMEYAIMTGEFGSEVRQAFFKVCMDGMFGMIIPKSEAIKTIKEHLRTGYPFEYGFTDAEGANGEPGYESRLSFTCRKPD